MNSQVFVLFLALMFYSIIRMNMQAETEDHATIEVSLKPRQTVFAGKSVIIGGETPHRVVRYSSTCKVPHELVNSNVTCISYPSTVKCIQSCMFGYTFSEGVRRIMTCEHLWNKWMPSTEFESCEPFVDCGVSLRSGGKIKCYDHFMDKGAICEISCHHYEDKPAIPLKVYGCNIDGSWTPPLPFCAQSGSGLPLVPVPRR